MGAPEADECDETIAKGSRVLSDISETTARGRIIVSHSQTALIEDGQGQWIKCLSKRSIGRPVCGDYVHWSPAQSGEGVIERIEERRNIIARPNFRGKLKPMAANVDLLIIVVAPYPSFDLNLVDRYTVLAAYLDMDALIVVNKVDRMDDTERQAAEAAFAPYPDLGYPVHWLSVKTEQGLGTLLDAMAGKTSALVGQSGVGKSSMVKALLPDIDIRVGAVSEASGLGKHTTTETTLYHLPHGGDLIDSPGIRMLRVSHLSPEDIANGFPECRKHRDHCQFSDCLHRGEPGCAVGQAVKAGEIAPSRWGSYEKLQEEAAQDVAGGR